MNTAEKLAAAAEKFSYLYVRETYRTEVTYSATGDERLVAAPHMWLDEYVIEVEGTEKTLASYKTPAAALRNLVKIADKRAGA